MSNLETKLTDLALSAGHNPAVARAGFPKAMAMMNAFVSRLPKRLQTQEAFLKVFANNEELVYGMMEACGLDLAATNASLQDHVHELEMMQDDVRGRLMGLSAWLSQQRQPVTTALYQLDQGQGGDSIGDVDEEDDLPSWKLTFRSGSNRHSMILDHREMAKHFPEVSVTETDPDPGFTGHIAGDDFDEDGVEPGEITELPL